MIRSRSPSGAQAPMVSSATQMPLSPAAQAVSTAARLAAAPTGGPANAERAEAEAEGPRISASTPTTPATSRLPSGSSSQAAVVAQEVLPTAELAAEVAAQAAAVKAE